MATTLSTPRPAAVKEVLARRWTRGYRKSDGRPFWSIPGGNGRVYLADESACNCSDFSNRQRACKHVLAVRERENELALANGLASDAEIDIAFASVAATARARDEAYGRQASIMAAVNWHIGED